MSSWTCPACGEAYAVSLPRYAPGFTCLADQRWFAEMYPKGMKHHWSDATPLGIEDGRFWYEVGVRQQLAAEEQD